MVRNRRDRNFGFAGEGVELVKIMTMKTRITIARLAMERIVPDAFYPVSYTIRQDGEKVFGDFRLQGKFLTEKQIVELAMRGVL